MFSTKERKHEYTQFLTVEIDMKALRIFNTNFHLMNQYYQWSSFSSNRINTRQIRSVVYYREAVCQR